MQHSAGEHSKGRRVLSVSPSVTGGGAERVALALHHRYLAAGVDSWLAVANVNADAERVLRIPVDAARGPWARALLAASRAVEPSADGRGGLRWKAARGLRFAAEPNRVRRVLSGHEDFEFPGTPGILDLPPRRPEVLQLHNLHGSYFDVRALPALSAAVPTVLTLHDAWLLTGHCAQPFECERWREGCGSCPALDRYVPLYGDESAANWQVKRQAVMESRLVLVSPSQWLLGMVKASGLLGGDVSGRVIPNGVDTEVFTPGDRAHARASLGIGPDRLVVAISGRDVRSNEYKGYDVLADAIRMLPESIAGRTTVLAIGDGGTPERLGAAEVRPIAFADDPAALARAYRASDVLAQPSRAEAFGLAVVEAMACGAAVVASRVGGLPEVVEDGVTGALVPAGDAEALAAAIGELLRDDERRAQMTAQGAARAHERFSLSGQVAAYLDLYEELVQVRTGEAGAAS